jgi:hypothetical protein
MEQESGHVTLLHTLGFSSIPESFGFIKLVRKIAKSVFKLRHVCVRLSAWNKSAPTGRIFIQFDI